MILSHTHKFIFICNSRVGTTSMEHMLRPLQEGEEYDFGTPFYVPKHIPPAILRAVLPTDVWTNYFKFVFVRNPWDWVVSQWFYNSVGAVPDETRPSGGVMRRARRSLVALQRSRDRRRLKPLYPPPHAGSRLMREDVDMVFEVLKRFRGLPGRDGHYQSNWVFDMDGQAIVDYVGRFETLQSDIAAIMQRTGLDLSLTHLNRTAHKDYRVYYSDEARERVAELWSVDLANFGYTFDPETHHPTERDTGYPGELPSHD